MPRAHRDEYELLPIAGAARAAPPPPRPPASLPRWARCALVGALVLAFALCESTADTQADHEHLVALTKSEPALLPLIHSQRDLIALQLEPRFTQNMHYTEHGVRDANVRVQVQVRGGGKGERGWSKAGEPWTLRIATDFDRWLALQRHHPGKGLEDLTWHSHVFDLGRLDGECRLSLTTNLPRPISLLLRVNEMGGLGRHRWLIALLIVVLVFGLIAFDVVHRTVAAALGCFLVLGTMAALGERATIHQVAGWLDVDTLLLLFGMMMLVGYLSSTGVFEWLAATVFGHAGRSPRLLVAALCVVTAFTSAFLDNVPAPPSPLALRCPAWQPWSPACPTRQLRLARYGR